jgi:hypothetical protein
MRRRLRWSIAASRAIAADRCSISVAGANRHSLVIGRGVAWICQFQSRQGRFPHHRWFRTELFADVGHHRAIRRSLRRADVIARERSRIRLALHAKPAYHGRGHRRQSRDDLLRARIYCRWMRERRRQRGGDWTAVSRFDRCRATVPRDVSDGSGRRTVLGSGDSRDHHTHSKIERAGPDYFATPNANTVCDWYRSPGRSTVEGKFAWFGESGKCCVSRHSAARCV